MLRLNFISAFIISFVILKNVLQSNSGSQKIPHCQYEGESSNFVKIFTETGSIRDQGYHCANKSTSPEEFRMWCSEESLYNLSSDSFRWLTNTSIIFLNLQSTIISEVDSDTLAPLQPMLKFLDLSSATISPKDLHALMFSLRDDRNDRTSYLTTLSLANISLTTVPYLALKPVQYSLKSLSFFGNDFYSEELSDTDTEEVISAVPNSRDFDVENGTDFFPENSYNLTQLLHKVYESKGTYWADFPLMPFLLELDLRQCNINYVKSGSFENLNNLRSLHISHNAIFVLSDYVFHGLNQLTFLDISHNKISSANPLFEESLVLQYKTFSELDSLTSLYFAETSFCRQSVLFLAMLPSSLRRLSLCNCDLTLLQDGVFEKLTELEYLDLSLNFGLGTRLTSNTFSGLDGLQTLLMVETALSHIKPLTGFLSLTNLNISRNNIDTLENDITFFSQLEVLDVSYNFIYSWNGKRIFENNNRLKTVLLHGNSLGIMSDYMLDDLKSLSNVTLAFNRFVCNCNLQAFLEYVGSGDDSEETTKLMYSIFDNAGHVCTDTSMRQLISFTEVDEFCTRNFSRFWLNPVTQSIFITILGVIIVSGIGTLVYVKWWFIKNFAILIKNATVMGMINTEHQDDRIFVYDIFVSYNDENRNWVLQELIPNIENEEARLVICLHERDFQVGVGILENIITAMDQSRIILLVISGSFLESRWCQFEMHLAQHRLMETCRNELVLVLLEDIPKRKRPKTLRYLMITKTYIVWPKDSEDVASKALFWKRLKRAIHICEIYFEMTFQRNERQRTMQLNSAAFRKEYGSHRVQC